MLTQNKPCKLCGIIDINMQFFLPPQSVSDAYKTLVSLGKLHTAAMMIKATQHTFDCYCAKCWVNDFVTSAMLDTNTTDDEKIGLINNHLETAMVGYDEELFWSRLGKPELN